MKKDNIDVRRLLISLLQDSISRVPELDDGKILTTSNSINVPNTDLAFHYQLILGDTMCSLSLLRASADGGPPKKKGSKFN